MKRKTFIMTSLLIMLTIGMTALLSRQELAILMSILIKPMAILGEGLRNLSLSGMFGNLLAWIVYLLISLLPLLFLGISYHKTHTFHYEDILLVVLSIVLLISMYYMINPHKLSLMTYWSISPFIIMLLIAYFVLKILRKAHQADISQLARYCSILLHFIVFCFLFASAYLFIYCAIKDTTAIYMTANSIPVWDMKVNTEITPIGILEFSKTIIFIQYFLQALPYFLGAIITNQLIWLLKLFQKDTYDTEIVNLLDHIILLSKRFIALIVLFQLIIQGLCVIAGDVVLMNHIQLFIPLTPLLFVLTVMLVSKIIRENFQLKKENDLFI